MNRRGFGIRTLGAIAAGLAVAVPATAFAGHQPDTGIPHARALHGTVVSVNTSAKTMVVAVKHGDDTPVNVTVNFAGASVADKGDHGKQRGRNGAAEAAAGDRVVAQGRYTSATQFTARRVHLIPGSQVVHAIGTAAVSGTEVTVTRSDGSTVKFATNADTKLRPNGTVLADLNGKKVVAMGRRQSNGTILATGISLQD